MNRWKKSLIVAGIFLAIGITGSIISGFYMIPKVTKEVYRVQREVVNKVPAEREVFVTSEQVDTLDISSLENNGFDVEIKPSEDENIRVKAYEYMDDEMQVEATYDATSKALKVVGNRTKFNLFQDGNIREFFQKSYDAVINEIMVESKDIPQIVIEVPSGVDVNFSSNYNTNLLIKDSKVLKDNLVFESNSGGYVDLPYNNTLKNINIKTNSYLEMDVREFINTENVKISCNSIEVYSWGAYKDYVALEVLPESIDISANYIDIKSYMPIGKNVILDSESVNYTTNFVDFAMMVDLQDNNYGSAYFHNENLGDDNDLSTTELNNGYSGYVGEGNKKDYNLKVSRYNTCEFEHLSLEELERELRN